MIDPDAIPRIPGDMDALVGHATALRDAALRFADTGADVHSTWQGLAPVYQAPEAELLLSATIPIAQVSDRVRADVDVVANALVRYANEVRDIQHRLRLLRAEAEKLVSEINDYPHAGHTTTSYLESGSAHAPLAARQVPATDWHDDEALVERDQHLNHQVNQAVAEWMEAQRRCANSINSLYGGTHYVADDGDAHHAPNEFGASTRQLDAASTPWGGPEQANPDAADLFAGFAHGTLDLLGMLPVIGEPADGLNAAWYSVEGDIVNAGLSAAGMIPLGGWFATGGKFAAKGAKLTENVEETARFHGKNIAEHVAEKGKDIGRAPARDRKKPIRLVEDKDQLDQVWRELSQGGQPIDLPNYPGTGVKMPDGSIIAYREKPGKGPTGNTIDMIAPDGQELKIHIEALEGR